MTIQTILQGVASNVLAPAIPVIVGLAVLVIFWGLAKYVYSAGSEDAKKQGKFIMVWGVIVLLIMSSLWGIVNVFQKGILGIDPTAPISPLQPQGGHNPFAPES